MKLVQPNLNEADKKRGLTWQLKFRQNVLGQYHKDKTVFTLSKKGKQKTSDELKEQLKILIRAASSVGTSTTVSRYDREKEHIPLLVGKRVIHSFEDGDYTGTVIAAVPGFPSWYNIKYDDLKEDDFMYSFRLVDDYKAGNLQLLFE